MVVSGSDADFHFVSATEEPGAIIKVTDRKDGPSANIMRSPFEGAFQE